MIVQAFVVESAQTGNCSGQPASVEQGHPGCPQPKMLVVPRHFGGSLAVQSRAAAVLHPAWVP